MMCVVAHAQDLADIHTQHHQELLQGQPAVYEEINLLDTVAMKELLIAEPWISEAALLYGENWSSDRVNPYDAKKMELPDSMVIDLSNYCIPHNGYITSNYGSTSKYSPAILFELHSMAKFVSPNMSVVVMDTM